MRPVEFRCLPFDWSVETMNHAQDSFQTFTHLAAAAILAQWSGLPSCGLTNAMRTIESVESVKAGLRSGEQDATQLFSETCDAGSTFSKGSS